MTITPAMEMSTAINARIAAQVALEYVINDRGDGMERVTIEAVIANAVTNDVSDFYIDMAKEIFA